MKKKIFLLIILFIFLLPNMAIGVMMDDAGYEDLSTKEAIDRILSSQSVSGIRDINCGEVFDDQFEELGETVMDVMHPDRGQHELMDQMMGGEGSASLKAAHQYMGKQYLGCLSNYGMMGQGMMGSMMMGSGMMGMMGSYGQNFGSRNQTTDYGGQGKNSYSMMGFGYLQNYFGLGRVVWVLPMIFIWILIILGLVWGIKAMAQKNSSLQKPSNAMNILKERYARGEIDRKEFEHMKKDII